MKTRESTTALRAVRVCASRGLAREALGLWILSYLCYEVLLAVCHSPFPEVSAVFCFFDVLWGLSSGGCFLVWGAPLYPGGLWEAYVWGDVWMGSWRSVRAELGRL